MMNDKLRDTQMEMDEDNEDETLPSAYQRAIKRMIGRLEDAAATAVIADIEREFFLEMAGKCFDFMKRWNDHKQ